MSVTELDVGRSLGEYRIERFVRRDGHVAVYRARQERLGREVELRVVPAADEAFLARARRLSGVDHPHVLPVYDAGSDGEVAFAALRASAATPVAEVASRQRLAPDTAVRVAEQIADALRALEARGMTPRLREDAVLLDGETAYVDPLRSTEAPGTGASPAALGAMLATLVGDVADSPLSEVLDRPQRYETGEALLGAARAAVAPLPSPGPVSAGRRWVIAGAAGVVLAAVAVAVVLVAGGGEDGAAGPARPSATTPAARIAATIALGAKPMSVSYGTGAVWVGTTDRQLLRVDPKAGRVVGTPVRIARGNAETNITVRAGLDAVFAFDYASRAAIRVDARTGEVTRRVKLVGAPTAAAVANDVVWTVQAPPSGLSVSRIVALDPRTLQPTGRATTVRGAVSDLEVDGPILYAPAVTEGTVTRIDSRTGARRTVAAGATPLNVALIGGRLWVPDVNGHVVSAFDPDLSRPPSTVLATGTALSVVRSVADPWVVTAASDAPDAPTRLIHIDAASGRRIGAPLALGDVLGWPAAGGGALWIQAAASRGC